MIDERYRFSHHQPKIIPKNLLKYGSILMPFVKKYEMLSGDYQRS
jgi:hypothetical protein